MLPWLVFLIVSAAECVMLALFPALNLLVAIFWGATLILAGIYLHRQQLIIVYLADIVVLYSFMGILSLMVFMLFFGIAGLFMSYLTNLGKNYYFIQSSGVIVAVLCVSLFLFNFYFGTEQAGSAEQEAELNTYMQEAIDNFSQSDLYQTYKEQGITMEEIENGFNEAAVIIFKHLPAIFYLQAIMAVFFMLFFAQLASQTCSIKRLRKKAYIQEIMPWQIVWVFIAGIGLWLWGSKEASAVYYLGSNILAVISPIAIYYGLSVALYIFNKTPIKKSIWLIILIVFIVIIFTLPIIIMLGLIGLFDALIDYRKIRLQEEG